MNAQRRSVNLVPGMSAPAVLHASEGDVGRVLEIVIIDGQLVYNIPSTATVTITATKPSGMGFTQTCTVTENGTATFETTASMTDESGKMQAEVRIVDGGKNIGTANLLWIVERNPHPSNVIDGDVERAKTILERAEEAMAKAEQMIEEVEVYNSIVEEVEDIRVGVDGKVYDSAGDAVRGQVSDLKEDLNYVNLDIYGRSCFEVEQGSVNANTGAISDNTNYVRTTKIGVIQNKTYTMTANNKGSARVSCVAVYYSANDKYLSSATVGWIATGTGTYTFTTPENAHYMRLRFSYYPVATITPLTIDISITQAEAWKQVVEDGLANSLQNKGVITTPGLDLNTGDFIKSGSWAIADVSYIPSNYPSDKIGRIVSIATTSDSSFSTIQIVVDNTDTVYVRYSNSNESWVGWKQLASYNNISYVIQNSMFNYGNITTKELDLNGGIFIHPGVWAVNDTQYMPYHSPTNNRCRIISYASSSDNTIYTYQVVIDSDNIRYTRFSTTTSVWSPWVCDNPYNKLSYKPSVPVCTFEATKHTQADTENYTMIWGNYSDRTNRLIAMYDAETNPHGYSINKSSLGKDATDTFDVWLYKVSLGYTNQTNKPVVLLVVGEHGNEPASAMTGYYAYKEILDGALSKYLTYVDFWVVPLMNPYGYEHNTRNNGNDVNLNRDFPANWVYRRDGHNDTDNYSMSQPETNYIINLCLQNKDRLLFVCNKHDTGAIGRKLAQNEVDTVGYLTTCLYTDSVINESICKYEDQQVKETDPYIVTACTADISKKQLIVNNSPHPLDGSLDLFLNTIGIHASLLEGSYGWNDGSNVYYDGDVYNNVNYATSQIRYITDFLVNYLAWTIQHSEYLQSSDRAYENYVLKSRKYNAELGTWDNITLWYNGKSIIEIP